MKKVRRRTVSVVCLLLLFVVLTGCEGECLRMTAEEVAENVVYNESMVGVSGTLNKYFRPKVVFGNDDENKIKYLTNNVHTGNTPEIDITIVQGAYYEAFVDVQGTEYARATVAAAQFDTAAAAENAAAVIEANLNLSANEDKTCVLEYGRVSVRKNVVFIVATYEENTLLELTRVFNNKNYVK